jgi:hypothetical protein
MIGAVTILVWVVFLVIGLGAGVGIGYALFHTTCENHAPEATGACNCWCNDQEGQIKKGRYGYQAPGSLTSSSSPFAEWTLENLVVDGVNTFTCTMNS